MEPLRFSFSVAGTPYAVTDSRHRVVAGVRDWRLDGADEVLEDVALVTSELLTNAVRHAGYGPISVAAELNDGLVRIEVCDSSPVLPKAGLPGADDENGRGLPIRIRCRRLPFQIGDLGQRGGCWACGSGSGLHHPGEEPAAPAR
ncbi:ATP-binding protein [Streptomyces sp. NBC_00102]|uniref:ATP-binding protein n=1 Tax=Streptomyces sp. NBC_00102 TaxID=2975652 RepID=UPI00224CC80A|nr:ATP-binding protein [Streptomyces sp. NBC_00102]MCX5398531.1 ATP-binding protein [Streptomyces sp. NBC_00102]